MSGQCYEVHCHLFNKDILSNWLRIIIAIAELEDSITPSGRSSLAAEIELHLHFLKRVKNFLKIGTLKDSTAIYKEMLKTYSDSYVSVPLMMDFSYVSTVQEYKTIMARFLDEDWLPSRIRGLIEQLKSKVKDPETLELLDRAMKDLLKAYTAFQRVRWALDKRVAIPVFDPIRSFQAQIEQLTELKNRYPDKVFPFLSVDPRRPDILQMVEKQVGRDKPFHGIKLYSPLGFSPTDPGLFKDGRLYDYCRRKEIPVTAHCSCVGVATYVDEVIVTGHVYDIVRDKVREVDHELIHFQAFFPHVIAAIKERAAILNHPKIWEKVVDKYPNLRLNLAHLGGPCEEWRNLILDMMKPGNSLYSDLACQYKLDVLRTINREVFQNQRNPAQDRIMYGSDYYVLLLFADDLAGYRKSFVDIFGNNFDRISMTNPNPAKPEPKR